jgi:hypothetical protein
MLEELFIVSLKSFTFYYESMNSIFKNVKLMGHQF